VSEKPSNVGVPPHMPSDAMTVASPIFMLACITLFSEPGGIMPAAAVGASAVAHQRRGLARRRAL
jgi:hypothetical protein